MRVRQPRTGERVGGKGPGGMGSAAPEPTYSLPQCFDQIAAGCKTIAAPSDMMPIVCLSKDAFPVVTSFLHLEDSTPTEIQLPVVAAAICGKGRVICFSQLQFLTNKYIHTGETAKLVMNSVNWISGGQNTMTPILALGFDKQTQQGVVRTFQDLGFFVESGYRQSFSNYKAIIMPSDIDLSNEEKFEKLVSYVRDNGGGIGVFYSHHEFNNMVMPINKLLLKFNLSFTYCLLNEDLDASENIQVPPAYTYVRDCNFVPLLTRFKALVKQAHVDTGSLDDLVTTLRYYIMVCDESCTEQLKEIGQYAWDFLERTEYRREDGICPEITHGIVVVLLLDVYSKLPPDTIKPIPEYEMFPGKTGDVELGDFEMPIKLQNETWISTGLWLPAGVVAVVECDTPMSDIHIQIGSQHESLLGKPGPWKRWPSTVTVTPFTNKVTNVVSAFGGIAYIAVNNSGEAELPELTFKFHNFCRHPLADTSRPEVWEETKDIEVPWGELVTGNVIFTLPTEAMKKIENFDLIDEKFQIIVNGISDYMSYRLDKPYRFVFDVELPEDCPSCGYPLVFNVEDIEGILMSFDAPSTQLFTAVTLMTIVSIREDCFDPITETAIATIATSVIFQKLFPNFDPLEFTGITLPTLFHELWELHSRYDPNLIPQTLAKFQDPEYHPSDVPDDMWIAFVREMCRIGKRDFTKLLERSRPIPMNIWISLQGLPMYQFVGCQ